ncbi:MAG TPA: right-handed parallel beta-helix repeat-containing protein [Verrucomicrobiota bacterium]|nr:right-handed parallel beta-helix repeat-containing protein [Verrucomicrobiota bacterium]
MIPGVSAASCDPVRTFADGRQPAREVFVSATGSDATGLGTRAQPFATLGRAAAGLKPGDAVRLLPGTHAPGAFLGGAVGTAEAPIWIGGVPGESRPVIAGGSQAFHLVRARYVVIEHLEIAGASQNGINCDDGGDYGNADAARYLLFRDVHFRDVGSGGNQDGLKLSGVNDYVVHDCEFVRISAGGSGIDHVGCHRGRIVGCRFTDLGGNAIQCKGGSEDIDIARCQFHNAGARAITLGGSTGFTYFRPPLSPTQPNAESRNIRVMANLFRGSDAPVAFVGTVGSCVANNTILEPRRWVMRILQETVSAAPYAFLPCASNRFVNNLVFFERGRISTFVNIGPNTDPGTFGFANNLWYAFDAPGQSRPSLPAPESNAVVGRDPLLIQSNTEDASLAPESPAVGAGLAPAPARADLLEQCYADPPTIGAWEARPSDPPRADTDGDSMPDDWELAHDLDPGNAGDALGDPDADGVSNRDEFTADTDPRDPASSFRIPPPLRRAGGVVVVCPTRLGRVYSCEQRAWTAPAAWTPVGSGTGDGTDRELTPPLMEAVGGLLRVRVELAPR